MSLLTVPKKFEDKVCVSALVYKMGDNKKNFKELPKGYLYFTESHLKSNSGQDKLLVLTGKMNDIICVDFDCMKFHNEHAHMFENKTYTDESFSGKRHYYFKYTPLVKNAQMGTFDILSDRKTAMLGKPLNDLPISEMTPEIIEYINTELLNRDDKNKFDELVHLMDARYVRAGPDWRKVARAFKLMNADYDNWLALSMKDSEGFNKNFNKDGVNCMESIWSNLSNEDDLVELVYYIGKQLDAASKQEALLQKTLSDKLMAQLHEAMPAFSIKAAKKILGHPLTMKAYFAKDIYRLAKKFEDEKVLAWLLINEFISSEEYFIPFKRLNKFDLDDGFYWNDFQKLVTRKAKYTDGEMLSLCSEHLYRVCAFADNFVIIKESKEKPHALYDLSKFCDLYVAVPSINRHDENTHFMQYIKKCHPRIIPDMKFPTAKVNFDYSYSDTNTFYASQRLLAVPGTARSHRLDKLLDFIKEILCDNDDSVYVYLMAWMAFMWKYPHLKTEKALLLYGEEGIGKGTIVDFLCNYVFGKHNTLPNASYDDIMSHKNSNLLGKKLVCVNELSSSLGKRTTNQEKLKSMITEYQFEMNRMCKDLVTVDNSFDFIFMTNNESSLKIKPGDRRFFCIHSSDKVKENKTFFDDLRKTCFNDTCASEFVTHLETLLNSPEEFRLMKTPMTGLKEKMITSSEWDSEFYEALKYNEIDDLDYLDQTIKGERFALFGRQDLMNVYSKWMKQNNYDPKRAGEFKKSLLKQSWASEKGYASVRYYAIQMEYFAKQESDIDNLEIEEA